MQKLYTARLCGGSGVLPSDFQGYLNNLMGTGKVFRVEEYYNDTMTVIVTGDGIFMYRTKEVLSNNNNSVNTGTVECTLSKARNLDDLYKNMIDRRVSLEVENIREVYKVIENFVKYWKIK